MALLWISSSQGLLMLIVGALIAVSSWRGMARSPLHYATAEDVPYRFLSWAGLVAGVALAAGGAYSLYTAATAIAALPPSPG